MKKNEAKPSITENETKTESEAASAVVEKIQQLGQTNVPKRRIPIYMYSRLLDK